MSVWQREEVQEVLRGRALAWLLRDASVSGEDCGLQGARVDDLAEDVVDTLEALRPAREVGGCLRGGAALFVEW